MAKNTNVSCRPVVWAILLGLLSGCTLIAPENELRVTEYDGNGWYMTAKGEAAGFRVVQSGSIKGRLIFRGKNGIYEFDGD